MSIDDDTLILDTARAANACFMAGMAAAAGSPSLNVEARSKTEAALDIAILRLKYTQAAIRGINRLGQSGGLNEPDLEQLAADICQSLARIAELRR